VRAGLEAELIAGDDAKAQKLWKACLAAAAPSSDEADDCRMYADMFGASRPDPAKDSAEARKSFAAGVAAHRKGDDGTASLRWHECLDRSETATLVRDQCMAAIDLLPKKLDLTATDDERAQKIYLEGMGQFMLGDFKKTRELWTAALAAADPKGLVAHDCRAGLAKLDDDEAAAAKAK
jgi:hypothetical protein